MTKWNPTLLENGELQLENTVEVPETLTFELWRAALAEKIQGTNLTLADMVEGLTQKDCQDLGIPWPEHPHDRSYEINQNLYELLIRTLWNGIIKNIKSKNNT